jgi:large subunit ribosomal protein L19
MTSANFWNLEYSDSVKAMSWKPINQNIEIGDSVKLSVKITEGNKERIQLSDGLVIAKKNHGINQTITVRKVVQGIGIERSFLIHSPKIVNLEITRKSKVRRSKLYFLRSRFGKSTRLKQRFEKVSK